MAAEASHLNVALVVAIFAVTHGPSVMGSAAQAGDGVTPNVAAVTADAVLFVNPFFIGCAKRAMAVGASEPCALHVNGVGEPDVGGLARVDEPGRGALRLQVCVDQFGFRDRRAELVGVAGGAGFVSRDAGERAVAVERVARFTIRVAGLLGVSLVQEIDGLLLMRVKNPGENDPTSDQGDYYSDDKGYDIAVHIVSFGTQFLVEKKC